MWQQLVVAVLQEHAELGFENSPTLITSVLEHPVDELLGEAARVDACLHHAVLVDEGDVEPVADVLVFEVMEGVLELVAPPDFDFAVVVTLVLVVLVVAVVDVVPELSRPGFDGENEGEVL